MKSNRIIWGLVALVVLITVTISVRTLHSQIQQKSDQTKQPDHKSQREEDRAKYKEQFPVTDYDKPEIENIVENEKRREKNKRYDNYRLVKGKPNPKTVETSRYEEKAPPPAIPTIESKVVIVGKVLNAQAYLSNDKSGVYSEFTVRVEELIQNNNSIEISLDSSITIDRIGGIVQYPSGQQVIYSITGKGLPRIGSRYVLFLNNTDQSSNYNILTGYELKGAKVYSLDSNPHFKEFNGTDEMNFLATIRKKVSLSSQKVKNQ